MAETDSGPLDLAVIGGVVATPGGESLADIGVLGGEIAQIATPHALPPARRVIDASGCYVLPGLVDPHTHPGNHGLLRDEIGSESRSAAIGGVTTMLGTVKVTRMGRHMPTDQAAGSYLDVVADDAEAIDANAHVDVGLSLIVMTTQHANEIEDAVREFGITSYKFHLTFPPSTVWGARIGIPTFPDDGTAFAGFQACATTGSLVMVHAENAQVIAAVGDRLAGGRSGLAAVAARFPGELEATEVRKAAEFARITGARCYIVHVSSAEAIDEISRARERGIDVRAETCPQYLVFDLEHCASAGALLKFNPPIRSTEHVDAIWSAVADGRVDAIGSDHVPHSRSMKISGGSPEAALPGSPGLATLLPVLWTHGVATGRLTVSRLVELVATKPAQLFGLYPRKGSLQPGSDADLVIVDPRRTATVDASRLGSMSDYSAYEGMELSGWPTMTILRGHVVAENGEAVGTPSGRYLRRPLT